MTSSVFIANAHIYFTRAGFSGWNAAAACAWRWPAKHAWRRSRAVYESCVYKFKRQTLKKVGTHFLKYCVCCNLLFLSHSVNFQSESYLHTMLWFIHALYIFFKILQPPPKWISNINFFNSYPPRPPLSTYVELSSYLVFSAFIHVLRVSIFYHFYHFRH